MSFPPSAVCICTFLFASSFIPFSPVITFLLLSGVLYKPFQPLLSRTQDGNWKHIYLWWSCSWFCSFLEGSMKYWAMVVFLSKSCLRMKGCNMSLIFLYCTAIGLNKKLGRLNCQEYLRAVSSENVKIYWILISEHSLWKKVFFFCFVKSLKEETLGNLKSLSLDLRRWFCQVIQSLRLSLLSATMTNALRSDKNNLCVG